MTSRYRNRKSNIACLLLCLFFITCATAQSIIRQFTDDSFNTNLQQPIQNVMDVEQYKRTQDEENSSSSRNYEVVSANSNPLTGMRDHPPTSYSVKLESFNTLLRSTSAERYESRPFSVGGYDWRLIVYPNGNTRDRGSGFLSLYVSIDNSSFVAAHQVVHVDLRFYIYNKNQRKFFTIQDPDVFRYNIQKQMWGFPQALSLNTFRDPRNGYLYDGDHCEFGVDVVIPTFFRQSELFTVNQNLRNPRFTWTIRGFSKLLGNKYLSDTFSIGGRNWNIQVNPTGHGSGEGKAMSMFLNLNENEKLRPYQKIYVRAKLRVLNQRNPLNNVERQIDHWFNGPGFGEWFGWGWDEFISLSELRNPSRGFLVNDVLMVQVEMEAISSTLYLPL